jgi:hypothetical protein
MTTAIKTAYAKPLTKVRNRMSHVPGQLFRHMTQQLPVQAARQESQALSRQPPVQAERQSLVSVRRQTPAYAAQQPSVRLVVEMVRLENVPTKRRSPKRSVKYKSHRATRSTFSMTNHFVI